MLPLHIILIPFFILFFSHVKVEGDYFTVATRWGFYGLIALYVIYFIVKTLTGGV